MIGKEVDVSKSVVDVKPIDAIGEIGDQQDDECEECDYEANSRSKFDVHQEPLYEDGYNERRKLELVVCRQSFECEDCDNKFPLKADLEVHKKNSHEEVPRIDWLNCSQEQYYNYYKFYEDCDEKTDSTEDVITKPDHDYVLGVIVIAAFFALSCSNLCIDQELQEDKYEDTKEEKFIASILGNCCGKIYKSMVALAIHTKKTHGKCSCYLETTNKSVQCDDCCFKFPTRTNLEGHLAMRHEVFEGIATELKVRKD